MEEKVAFTDRASLARDQVNVLPRVCLLTLCSGPQSANGRKCLEAVGCDPQSHIGYLVALT